MEGVAQLELLVLVEGVGELTVAGAVMAVGRFPRQTGERSRWAWATWTHCQLKQVVVAVAGVGAVAGPIR